MLKRWLKSLNDDTFIALAPPTKSGGPYDAAHVHEVALETIQARGLPLETPYIGWHSQTEAFNSKGRLVDVQAVYHGGDRDVIRMRLATIPETFEVSGGESDDEAFMIARRFVPDAIDLDDAKAVAQALATMHHGSWLGDHPRMHLSRQLSVSQLRWLHERLADPATELENRIRVFELLHASEDLTDDELDTLAAAPHAVFAESADDELDGHALLLVNALFERGRTSEAEAIALRMAGPRDVLYASPLRLVPTPATLAAAERLGQELIAISIRATVTATPVRQVAIERAVQLHAAAAEADTAAATASETATGTEEVLRQLVTALPELEAAPPAPRAVSTEDFAGLFADLLEDPSVPAWLLDRLLDRHAAQLADLRDDGTWTGSAPRGWQRVSPDRLRALAAALQSARARVAATGN